MIKKQAPEKSCLNIYYEKGEMETDSVIVVAMLEPTISL